MQSDATEKRGAAQTVAVMFAFCLAISFMAGFRGHRKVAEPLPTAAPPGATLSDEIRSRISHRVLEGVPNRGRLARVRKAGILRVALPPADPPFQQLDSANILYGFNVDLAEEIAGILLVKTNLVMLSPEQIETAARNCVKSEYDLVFIPPAVHTRDAKSMPYFYEGPRNTWRTLCPAGPDESLRRAVENTLSYLNESGVFMRIHSTYFGMTAVHP